MFWVISVYFNIRNTLPKSGTFLLGHPVYALHATNINLKLCRIKARDKTSHAMVEALPFKPVAGLIPDEVIGLILPAALWP